MNKPQSRHRAIALHDFPVGEPLPFSVYDSDDNLLLRKGFVVSSEKQRDRLLKHGLFQGDNDVHHSGDSESEFSQGFTVFETVETLLARLEHAYQLLREPDGSGFVFVMLRIAVDIQAICADNPDAVMGAMQVSQDLPYGLIHPLHCAVLCELMGKRLGLPQFTRLALVAGAASHDVGITQMQEKLHRQQEALSENQWQRIRRHPQESRELLEQAGVDDEIWLNAVGQHHERLDGSGYPGRLQAEQLSPTTRILAIVDIYTAMIRPRIYRDAFITREALRSLFQERGSSVDPKLVQVFVKEVGLFPPGAFVRLRNNELAVVQKRGVEASLPVIFSVQAADGSLMIPLRQRDPSKESFNIIEMLPHHEHPTLRSQLNEIWPPLKPISLR
ncbi:MAG: HD domain-containing phosphohydrolase [Motiliproteus sp.]